MIDDILMVYEWFGF